MKSGRPIIVADAGFYSDLPDDLVFKVPSSVEIQPLAEVLERLVSSETLRRETSAKAREWATKTFSAQAYVTAVESLIAQLIEVKPLLALGGRIGRDLAAIDISEDDPVIGRLAANNAGSLRHRSLIGSYRTLARVASSPRTLFVA